MSEPDKVNLTSRAGDETMLLESCIDIDIELTSEIQQQLEMESCMSLISGPSRCPDDM